MERSEEERREQGTRRAWIGIPRANQNRRMESLIWSRQVWELGAGGPRVRLRSRGSPGRSGSRRTHESGRGVGGHLAGPGAGGPTSQAEGSGVTWQVWEREDPRVRLRGQGSPGRSGSGRTRMSG